jgi:hypothetical protein
MHTKIFHMMNLSLVYFDPVQLMVFLKLKLKIISTDTNNSVCRICVYDIRCELRHLFQNIFKLGGGDRTKPTDSVNFMLYILYMIAHSI